MTLAFFAHQNPQKSTLACLDLLSIEMHAPVPVKLHLQILLGVGGFFQFGERDLKFAVTGSADRGGGNGAQPFGYAEVAF